MYGMEFRFFCCRGTHARTTTWGHTGTAMDGSRTKTCDCPLHLPDSPPKHPGGQLFFYREANCSFIRSRATKQCRVHGSGKVGLRTLFALTAFVRSNTGADQAGRTTKDDLRRIRAPVAHLTAQRGLAAADFTAAA